MDILEKRLTVPWGGMFSGQGEAVERVYRAVKGKSGNTWLYTADGNPDNIYVTNNPENTTSKEQGFQGFGGSTIPMELENGKAFMLHGGWHSNSEAFFEDTGIDIRNNYLTQIWVSLDCEGGFDKDVMIDVVYKEDAPVAGPYDRYEEIAKRIANELGRSVIVKMKSHGGGCRKMVEPVLNSEKGVV